MLALAGAAEAATTVIPQEPLVPVVQPVKPGSWLISYYKGPNGHKVTSTSLICVNSNHTWNIAGPINIPGTGGWSKDGNTITFYGSVGEAIQGAAFTAIGSLLGDNLITGHYVHFDIVQPWPNGDFGSFKATFEGAACPL
jgi:hypothetical protein